MRFIATGIEAHACGVLLFDAETGYAAKRPNPFPAGSDQVVSDKATKCIACPYEYYDDDNDSTQACHSCPAGYTTQRSNLLVNTIANQCPSKFSRIE